MTTVNAADLRAAEILWEALYALNTVDPDNEDGGDIRYATDNTYEVENGTESELSPYAHVRAAFMMALTRLAEGDTEHADMLLDALHENGGSVADNLRILRPRWTRPEPRPYTAANGHRMVPGVSWSKSTQTWFETQWNARCVDDCRACADGELLPPW